MKKIETVLAEANLTESQIGELVTLVEEGRADERASLRTIHIQEIKRLEAARDATIGSLMRELVEARKEPVLAEKTEEELAAEKEASDKAEKDAVEKDAAVEERISARVIAEADKMVEEALAVHAPMLRQAQGYGKMKIIVEGLRRALGVPTPADTPASAPADLVTESRVSDETVSLRERVASLEADVLVFEQTALFEQNTAGMADTTKERVKTLMEAARPRSLNDYADMLAVAVDTVKPALRKDNDPLNESRTVPPAATTVPQPAANLTGPALYAKSL